MFVYSAKPHLDGDDEVLEHLAGPCLDLDGQLGGPVHELRDLAELGLLHAARRQRGRADADSAGRHSRSVPLWFVSVGYDEGLELGLPGIGGG